MSDNESRNDESPDRDEASDSRALTPSAGEPKETAQRRLPLVLAVVAIVIAVLVAAAGGYGGWRLWQRLGAVSEQARTASAEARDAAGAEALRQRAEQLGSRIEDLREGVDDVQKRLGKRDDGIAKLRERVDAIESGRQSLEQRMADVEAIARSNKDDWKRSEAAYLATVAVHRLRYYQDVDAALGALKEAHELLSDFGGQHIEARQGVARAIDRLIEVEPPRIGRVRERLNELERAVADLPTSATPTGLRRQNGEGQDKAARMEGETWRQRARNAWNQFTGALGELVTISRERQGAPLRTPEERFFLIHNLKLRLEAARVAALSGDQASYEASLQRLEKWLDSYFDREDQRVAAVREQLAELNKARVSVELPDIAPLVERVRSFE